MDLSVLASIGSFMVSEHVLKPKASVLIILGCVLAYDLTTKTHDVSSLRVYRGPGLLAFALSMVAYSLRTWRRNGVACDELLFLPGTAHADNTIGNETHIGLGTTSHSVSNAVPSSRRVSSPVKTDQSNFTAISTINKQGNGNNPNQSSQQPRLEGDVAAGVGTWNQSAGSSTQIFEVVEDGNITKSSNQRNAYGIQPSLTSVDDIELANLGQSIDALNNMEQRKLLRSRSSSSKDSTISSINEFDSTWDDDPLQVNDDLVERFDGIRQSNNSNLSDDSLMVPLKSGERDRECSRTNSSAVINENDIVDAACPSAGDLTIRAIRSHVVSDIREGQAQITRFGSLFFFRSTTTSTQNAAYAPSGPSVVGAAIDLSMPILFNFHLFIQAWNHLDVNASKTPAKILPMCFLTALTVRLFIPLGRRSRFWGTLKYTLTAPFHRSRFRDSFLGDILTSLVRPLQDVSFAAAYYVTGLWGLISSKYDLTESGEMLESSWILHTIILPSCALLPLWWKFLQTLRESYDMGHRWPYLGNAFKYLSAALVIMYGMTHPEERGSISWMFIFCLVLMYQVWWDTFMDWELFVIVPKPEDGLDSTSNTTCCTRISSIRPSSYILLTLHRYVLNPAVESIRYAILRLPSWKQFQIRPRRLYKTEAFYWKIFFFNTFFRFTWMLSFIPSYSLTRLRVGPKEEFESDTDSYIGVLLPVAEIFRRTLWALLLLEIQTIHMTDGDPDFRYSFSNLSNGASECDLNQDEESDTAFSIDSSKRSGLRPTPYLPSWLYNQLQLQDHALHPSTTFSYMSSSIAHVFESLKSSPVLQDQLFFMELCLWAVAFVGLGLWSTA